MFYFFMSFRILWVWCCVSGWYDLSFVVSESFRRVCDLVRRCRLVQVRRHRIPGV